MNSKFFDLKQEKQDRMINAALKIFALNGYNHASTDDIVKEARISKGLLFHYFDSKIGVYTFIYDFSVRFFLLELSSAVDPSETSYFEIRRQMEAAKMQCLKSYPYMQMFMNSCRHEDILEAVLAIKDSRENFEKSVDIILSKADRSVLMSSAYAEALTKMLDYTLDGLMVDEFATNSFNAELLYKESLEYIKIVEKSIK